jgi:hypothetical protein
LTPLPPKGSIIAMNIYELAVWGVILGLSLMMVGGLMLWAYGARRRRRAPSGFSGPEAESARYFHLQLARWFFLYGVTIIIAGIGLILWASSILFKP